MFLRHDLCLGKGKGYGMDLVFYFLALHLLLCMRGALFLLHWVVLMGGVGYGRGVLFYHICIFDSVPGEKNPSIPSRLMLLSLLLLLLL